jgi:hypothetical protein
LYRYIWVAVTFGYHEYSDKASTLHIYQSPWGYILYGLRGFGLFWFWYSSYITLQKYNAKVHFYCKFVAGQYELTGGLKALAWFQPLSVQGENVLSKFAFKWVNLYRYIVAAFSLWFVGLPVTVCVAFSLDPWWGCTS